MLKEIGFADAYAIPWEFSTFEGEVDFTTFYQHPKYHDLRPSQYTDDTLRSLATTMVVVNHLDGPESPFDPLSYIKAIQRQYARDKRPGWSKRFQAFLEEHQTSTAATFLGAIQRRESNGSVMGVLPIGYLREVEHVKLAAMAQAVATHSEETIRPAQALALSAHFLLHRKGSLDALRGFLVDELNWHQPEEEYNRPNGDWITMDVYSTTHAVLAMLFNPEFDSVEKMIREAIRLRGDTDSVAALSAGLASCSEFHDHTLPPLARELDEGSEQTGYALLELWDEVLERRLNR